MRRPSRAELAAPSRLRLEPIQVSPVGSQRRLKIPTGNLPLLVFPGDVAAALLVHGLVLGDA
jgi:hypothetical protein